MHRRNLLQTIAALAAGSGLATLARAESPVPPTKPAGAPEKGRRRQFIEASDGTHLFFRDFGTGRPMLFVAPWAMNSACWEYQMTEMADHNFRCIAYDRRGHGRSDEPNGGCNIDTLADDLAAVIDQLDLRNVVLVGHSMGCGEVVRYISRHGSSRIARIVLVGTITPFALKTDDNPDGVDAAVLENVRKTLRKERPHPIAAAAPAFFGLPKNSVTTEIMDWWVRMLVDGCSLKTMVNFQRMFSETDFRPDLRTISVPTLLIHGDNDTSALIEKTARKTLPLIRGAELRVYEGAAHGLPITHAERLNADLLEFAK
jgi:non-heme chloroperoxidase